VEEVFQEHISSGSKVRPELAAALDVLRQGDTFIVWRLDRLGRNMRELDDLVTQFKKQGIRFTSLTEAIDTTTASGKLYFHIIAAFAEYEREGIRERTRAGVEAARARGRKGGRKHKLSPAQRTMVVNAYNTQTPIRDICHQFRISHTTIHRILKADKAEQLAASLSVQAKPIRSRTRLAHS
jgi:DNA invertase Pin-like site-specific DNA recombinase